MRMTADLSTPPALVADLDAQVRTVVRCDGVDPQAEAHQVRRIAEQVVRDHDFGPLQRYLDDPTVEDG